MALTPLALAEVGVSGSPPPFFFVFLVVDALSVWVAATPSSSAWMSGSPDSMPSSVRRRSSRSFLKRRSFCSRRFSSVNSASSSAISVGVRLSRDARYFLRVTSRSVETVRSGHKAEW